MAADFSGAGRVRRRSQVLRGSLALALAMSSWAGHAVPLLFSFTSATVTADFTLDSSPTPDFFTDGSSTGFLVSGNLDGAASTYNVQFNSGAVDTNYGLGPARGGIYLDSAGGRSAVTYYYGQQIYGGTEASPTFAPQVYSLSLYGDGSPGTLTVTAAGPEAPAPLLGAGLIPALASFGGLIMTRVRRRKLKAAA